MAMGVPLSSAGRNEKSVSWLLSRKPPAIRPEPKAVSMLAVTETPLSLTSLPAASRNWTAGWVTKATPLWALLEGCVVITN